MGGRQIHLHLFPLHFHFLDNLHFLPSPGACTVPTMAIRVVEFSMGGTKLERFLTKNQHTQRKLLNFENWVNVEVSKVSKFDQNYLIINKK